MAKRTYRIGVYWEEQGGIEEGSMEDCYEIRIPRKPTRREMRKIADAAEEASRAIKKRKVRR